MPSPSALQDIFVSWGLNFVNDLWPLSSILGKKDPNMVLGLTWYEMRNENENQERIVKEVLAGLGGFYNRPPTMLLHQYGKVRRVVSRQGRGKRNCLTKSRSNVILAKLCVIE
jgi:hypothetical protein